MDVILTAGGIPGPRDSLYAKTQGAPKALLPLAGKPMIQWLLDTLAACTHINHVVIAGIDPVPELHCTKPLHYTPDQGNMLANILAGAAVLNDLDSPHNKLCLSSDVPLLTAEQIEWFISRVEETDNDFYYSVVAQSTMEQRFPGSKRTYLHFKDVKICGGDLACFKNSVLATDSKIWERLMAARKTKFRQAALIGFDVMLLLLIRAITLKGLADRAGARVGIKAEVIISPYPEMGMDIDKLPQFDLAEQELKKRNL